MLQHINDVVNLIPVIIKWSIVSYLKWISWNWM